MSDEQNEKATYGAGKATYGAGAAQQRRRPEQRVLVIEQLPGGFIVTDQSSAYVMSLQDGPPGRSVVHNIDALIGAVNRWHRDGQRAEHD